MAKNLNISLLLDYYAPVLTENQREVLRLYYNEDLSLAEIADGSGISRQGVRDAIKRGEAVMTDLEEKLHFAEWYKASLKASAEIRFAAGEIADECVGGGRYDVIRKNAEKIIAELGKLEHD